MKYFKTRIQITKQIDLEIPDWFSEALIGIVVDASGTERELEEDGAVFSVPLKDIVYILKNASPELSSYAAYLRWLKLGDSIPIPKVFTFTKDECVETGKRIYQQQQEPAKV